MSVRPSVIEALRLVRGSLRLIILRWLLWILAALPGVLVAVGGLSETVGRRPYFADAPDPLPMLPLARLLGETPPTVWGTLGVGVAVAWFGNLLLTAGAVQILHPANSGRVRVLRTVVRAGTRWLWAYLRIALIAVLLLAIGGRLIGLFFEQLSQHGRLAGWTSRTLTLALPVAQGSTLFLWAALVGVFVWWSRVIIAADSRRYVRRVLPLAVRTWWRHPVQSVVFHLLLALLVLFAGALVLAAWRQSPASTVGWFVLWLTVLLFQAVVWHWRLRACCLVWHADDLMDLRSRPDRPWLVLRRLRIRWRAWRRRPGKDRPDSEAEKLAEGNPEGQPQITGSHAPQDKSHDVAAD